MNEKYAGNKDFQLKGPSDIDNSVEYGEVFVVLKPIHAMIMNTLENYAMGKENAIFGKDLALTLGISIYQLRKEIKQIRERTDLIIGADPSRGYYIPLQDELDEAYRYRQNKALSELKGNALNDFNFILKAYKVLNGAVKTLDDKAQAKVFDDIFEVYDNKYPLSVDELLRHIENESDAYTVVHEISKEEYEEDVSNIIKNGNENEYKGYDYQEFPKECEVYTLRTRTIATPGAISINTEHEGVLKYGNIYVRFISYGSN